MWNICLAFMQAAEDGGERETCHGATKKENGERGAKNDEKRAKDRCQTFVTFIQHQTLYTTASQLTTCWIRSCFVPATTLLSSRYFWSPSVVWKNFIFFFFLLCILDKTQHKEPFPRTWVIVNIFAVKILDGFFVSVFIKLERICSESFYIILFILGFWPLCFFPSVFIFLTLFSCNCPFNSGQIQF